MIKVINENDIRIANNIERCRLLIAIIERTSNIYTRYKNTLKECENMNEITKETRKESFKKNRKKQKDKINI